MKIVIASDIYYPMTNGVAVFSHNLANGLAKAGHEVLVISPSFNGKFHTETDPATGVKTVFLTSLRFPFYPDQINEVPEKKDFLGISMPRLTYKNGIWWSVNPFFEIKKVLNEFQPDVIHLQTAETIALAIMRYVKKYKVPLVSTGHAYPDNITDQLAILKPKFIKKVSNAMLRAYMASFLKHAEYATMPTEMAIGDLIPKNRKHFKVPVEALSNGVDLSEFYPKKPNLRVLKKYGLNNKSQKILYVGRVDPEKSINLVLRAFRDLLDFPKIDAKKMELVIVGDGIDLVNLKTLASELGIDKRVKFLGKVMPPDLIEIYRAGTLFVTASETETQGIVLIEAAAVGLPLVAVDAGAVSELCQNKRNGELCRPQDYHGIALAIQKIILDSELAKQYRLASIEVAKRHDLKRTIDRFEEIYEQAIILKTMEEKR